MTAQTKQAKCGECQGSGKLTRNKPAVAMAFVGNPDDWHWVTEDCWRCKGTGKLPTT